MFPLMRPDRSMSYPGREILGLDQEHSKQAARADHRVDRYARIPMGSVQGRLSSPRLKEQRVR